MAKQATKAKQAEAAAAVKAAPEPTIIAYKGFGKDWTCRDFQYEIGKTYHTDGDVIRCGAGGFHSCESPFDVLRYYPMKSSRFAVVEVGGKIDRATDSDTKIASATITIKAELTVPEFIQRAVAWVIASAKTTAATGYYGHAAATGTSGHAAATGNYGHAAATGYSGHAAATGYYGHAAVKGKNAIAAALGIKGAAMAEAGSAIMLAAYSDSGALVAVFASKIGENGIKAGVKYRLGLNGKPVEV